MQPQKYVDELVSRGWEEWQAKSAVEELVAVSHKNGVTLHLAFEWFKETFKEPVQNDSRKDTSPIGNLYVKLTGFGGYDGWERKLWPNINKDQVIQAVTECLHNSGDSPITFEWIPSFEEKGNVEVTKDKLKVVVDRDPDTETLMAYNAETGEPIGEVDETTGTLGELISKERISLD